MLAAPWAGGSGPNRAGVALPGHVVRIERTRARVPEARLVGRLGPTYAGVRQSAALTYRDRNATLASVNRRVLVIDNYDSFTYNLVQYLMTLGADCQVHLNDRVSAREVASSAPHGILLSPGPGTPNDAGVTLEVIREFAGKIPILGVCLGHQSIGQSFGGDVIRAPELMHGKTSSVLHDGRGVFASLPSPFEATRYHSLVVDPNTLPTCLERTAWTSTGEIMGIRHRSLPVEGLQFHPESFLTEHGMTMLDNWLNTL